MRYEPEYTMEHNKERKVPFLQKKKRKVPIKKERKVNRNTEYCHKRKVVSKHELGI